MDFLFALNLFFYESSVVVIWRQEYGEGKAIWHFCGSVVEMVVVEMVAGVGVAPAV